jgi:beta-N-acetylhexosaminidase
MPSPKPVSAGDLLLIGLPGPALDAEARALLDEVRPLGVILFRRNIVSVDQLRDLTAALREDRPDQLVSIDHEGGRVHRMPEATFTHFPPILEIVRRGDPALLREVGLAHAAELRAAGFDLTYAPVLDVHTNPDNPIIGDRAFGATPEEVIHYALPYLQGLTEGGILGCGKHFPGHGDTRVDSHLELPVLPASTHGIQRLRTLEMRPFARAIAQGIPMLMTAHVVCEALDPGVPATLSRRILGDILRRELGYNGFVVSDDLEMKAIADHYPAGRAAVEAVLAGCDGCLVCATPSVIRECHEALARAIADREIPEPQLEAAAGRGRRLLDRRRRLARVPVPADAIGCERHASLCASLRGEPAHAAIA